MAPRFVELLQGLLKKNDDQAKRLREVFAARGMFVFNLLSSPGAGKTTLLEETLRRLAAEYKTAALVGDQATDNDARRLLRSGSPVRQITTGAECRLDASMVERALEGWLPHDAEVVAIENVGNLICPAEYDLGEDLRVALFSVTEGEDKPLKYPLAFYTAHLVLVTKIDLAEAAGFDRATALTNVARVHPDVPVLEVSAHTGQGMEKWLDALRARIASKRRVPVP
jgi:hydrogenase nickel incorporation protein HypB